MSGTRAIKSMHSATGGETQRPELIIRPVIVHRLPLSLEEHGRSLCHLVPILAAIFGGLIGMFSKVLDDQVIITLNIIIISINYLSVPYVPRTCNSQVQQRKQK